MKLSDVKLDWARVVAVAFCFCVFAAGCRCGREEPKTKPNQPPRVDRIIFTPSRALPGDTVRAIVEMSDPDLDPVWPEWNWYVNDKKLEDALELSLDTSSLHPGDEIYLEARAVDPHGLVSGWTTSKVLELASPPEPVFSLKAVKLTPERIYAFTKVHAAVDYGGQDPQAFPDLHYRWLVNGDSLAQSFLFGSTLEPKYFQRGDKLQVWVSLDESFQGPAVLKSKIHEVINLSPNLEQPPELVEEGDYLYVRVVVKDPEGDKITFILQEAPPGTRMDPDTGEIVVYRPDLPPGAHKISFIGKDGHGGEMRYTLTLTINAPTTLPPAPRPAPSPGPGPTPGQ